ncbi:hypothetical protein PC9H_002460 [Pleurotus ostreatus]|uniref:Uncharacterized protein n=1 Tax=Pleurotus ostreatus TaxID=5322 RepID=A0A8H6ZJY8_PLEOS|nr:uncharacterized protein PC9H_002460 [Pleurotus ostreatus]KAF7416196.1 hypothetical protein PC9H_002460 [Pleurotus ostreatus]KAJ8689039.1 hypothetical protein PTI98_013103 [Pleurotus ostreatus]
MFLTRARLAAVHQPLIKFIGRRQWPSTPEIPHFHPAAPVDLRDKSAIISKAVSQLTSSPSPSSSSSKSSGSGKQVYSEFWEAPERFWKPRVRYVPDFEIDAILSGGASLRK